MDEQSITSTHRKLLDVAKRLMMSKGYNGTTVEEICKAAAVTKGAFFHYFKTKEAVGESVLMDYWQTRYTQFTHGRWIDAPRPLEQIHGFLAVVADVFMNDPNGYSCLAGSFTQELATTHPTFRTLVAGLFSAWTDQIRPILQAAKALSPTANTVDVDLLAEHIVVVVEGALILAMARQDPQVIARHLSLLDSQIQSIFHA